MTEKQEKPVAGEASGGDAPERVPNPEHARAARAKNRAANKRANAKEREAKSADTTAPAVIEIRPMARKARMRNRHWGVLVTFFIIVMVPLALTGFYLYERATDQYASIAGFSVSKGESSSSAGLLGGLTAFVGSVADGETEMLYEFIQSPDLVAAIDSRIDLWAHYSAPHENDPVFALKPGGTIEDLVEFWQRIVKVSYDSTTGLVSLHVIAFSPEMAQTLAQEIIAESQVLVNQLNATARADTLSYAEQDLGEAVERLKSAREALIHFRTRTQIVDPESDLEGRMGILNGLQQQLAQALVEYDILVQDSSPNDPRVAQELRRIEVIRARLTKERENFANDTGVSGTQAYPELLAEYEGLVVDREFGEESYRVALATLDVARANFARQSRYLATYVRPTLPQKAEYPQRMILFGLAALFLFLLWAIVTLMYYAVRDRK